MALSTAQLTLIEQRVTNDGPSQGVAYLLWFFLGGLGGHRFYLGRPGTAILMIVLWILLIVTPIWWLIDAFLIPGMIRAKRDDIRRKMTMDMLAAGGGGSPSPVQPEPVAIAPPA